jgi:rhodanese-related sulfurtransferase
MLTLTSHELVSLLEKSPETIDLIDVRESSEYEEVHIPEARLIPLAMLPIRLDELDTKKQIIFICRSGGRSGQACTFVEWEKIQAYNLSWGMNDFAEKFPTKVI